MKKVFAFLLLAAFAVQSFNNTFIVFSFYVNQKKIVATLCENRYRPMLHCDGKCVLAKKIKQEENKDNQNPERKPENKNEVISSKSFFATIQLTSCESSPKYILYMENEVSGDYISVFHPPSA
ncbi:MAG: hypothetical protein JST09_00160 [Bacteroidetes bacterium]|nr:hypothetical protein [Bacteroidota bacterium]MBS1607968.1 hypothetical protein [Bacteroidota bacterium]